VNPFDPLWAHVHHCPVCSHAERHMCPEGERLLAEATTTASEQIAPMPKEAGKA